MLLQGEPDDFVIFDRSVVENVKPDQPEPLREFSQHDIGDELHENLQPATKALRHEQCLLNDNSLNEIFKQETCHEDSKARRKHLQ